MLSEWVTVEVTPEATAETCWAREEGSTFQVDKGTGCTNA